MKIKFLPVIITFLFLILFVIFLKGLKNSNIYIPNLIQDKKIPSFTSQLFDSTKEIDSNQIFVGNKFYLLNIWSSWCVPCRYEHEFLVRLNKEKNLKIIGLNYKDNRKILLQFHRLINFFISFIKSSVIGPIIFFKTFFSYIKNVSGTP